MGTFSFTTLLEEFPEYCRQLLEDSVRYLPIYDEVCVGAAKTLYEILLKTFSPTDSNSCVNESDTTYHNLIHLSFAHQFVIPENSIHLSPKKNIHFRIKGMPTEDYSIPRLSNKGQFVTVKGIVIRCTDKKIIEYQQKYQCKQCEFDFMVKADYEQHYIIPKPTEPCSNCPDMKSPCNSIRYRLLKTNKGENPMYPKDFQEIKIQESYGNTTKRVIPCNMWVTLEDDLVDQCKPGDEVIIS